MPRLLSHPRGEALRYFIVNRRRYNVVIFVLENFATFPNEDNATVMVSTGGVLYYTISHARQRVGSWYMHIATGVGLLNVAYLLEGQCEGLKDG